MKINDIVIPSQELLDSKHGPWFKANQKLKVIREMTRGNYMLMDLEDKFYVSGRPDEFIVCEES